ncbi:septation protein SepH [Paraoerskovia marina]|uniref:septation protein SepH n=1 Tax=Paraoerskovia marina TaxID=545619 RepID=UPI0004922399|nr:septation protein SepH [Paraoerskovia marina]
MSELELVKLHEDGEHLVLSGPGGKTFLLPITEALRAAVRRDRARMEHWRAADSGGLSPRAIQSRLRAGESPEHVATSAGVPLEQVHRFSGPVLAEQEYVVSRLRAVPADPSDPDSDDLLGERVDERLSLRNVSEEDRSWSARREPGEPWTVELRFAVDGDERKATWSFDQTDREHHALDDEARWLGQEADDTEVWRTATSAYRATRPVLAAVDDGPREEPQDPTHSLLDDLSLRRGVRNDDEPQEHDETSPVAPGVVLSLARVTPEPPRSDLTDDDGPSENPGSARDEGGPEDVPSTQEVPVEQAPGRDESSAESVPTTSENAPGGDDGASTERREKPGPDQTSTTDEQVPDRSERTGPSANRNGRRRKGRAVVPSWDDIVFGAKHD